MYYNTVELTGQELKDRVSSAATQMAAVQAFFEENAGRNFTPYEVAEKTGIECITSVRRSITDLTERGVLVKTGIRRVSGPYGQSNFTWVYPKQGQLILL